MAEEAKFSEASALDWMWRMATSDATDVEAEMVRLRLRALREEKNSP